MIGTGASWFSFYEIGVLDTVKHRIRRPEKGLHREGEQAGSEDL